MPSPQPKPETAVLFDLDGTLLDSLGDLAESMNAVLREHGLPTHSVDAFRYHIGDGIRELVKRSLPEALHDEGSIATYLERYRASYAERWHLSQLFPGVPALLDSLQARGVPVAVVSNKPEAFTRQCVERLFSNWSWAAVVGQREGVPRKPDPASALAVARDLACPPDRCWFVGDSDVDMQTGRNAGMRVVGVNWGFRPEEELRQAGAHHLIAHPEALLGLLDEAANEEGA